MAGTYAFTPPWSAGVPPARFAQQRGFPSALRGLRESVWLAQPRYSEGASSFLEVLDAQRALYQADIELARSAAQVSTQLVAVYKALGGAGDGSASVNPLE